MPSGTEMHLGVYGMAERGHIGIQWRRNDFNALLMYLTEQKVFFSVNRVFTGLTGRRDARCQPGPKDAGRADARHLDATVPARAAR